MKRLIEAIRDMLAAIGMMAVAAFIGLYYSGLFKYLAEKNPENWVLQLIGK